MCFTTPRAFLPHFSPSSIPAGARPKCLLPLSACAKERPNPGWPQLVVQRKGEALEGGGGASSEAKPRADGISVGRRNQPPAASVQPQHLQPLSEHHQSPRGLGARPGLTPGCQSLSSRTAAEGRAARGEQGVKKPTAAGVLTQHIASKASAVLVWFFFFCLVLVGFFGFVLFF